MNAEVKAKDAEGAKEAGSEGYQDPPMTIWEHLTELRKRLLVCVGAVLVLSIVAWEFHEEIFAFMVKPFADAWRTEGIAGEPKIHVPTPAAALIGYFKISLVTGLLASAPIIFYQLWAFVAPGLYAREKKFVIPFVAVSSLLFVGGGYFGWRLGFPIAFRYLLSLSGTLDAVGVDVTPTVMMGDYIDFVTRMLLGFGVIFELPLFLFFLSITGIVNYLFLLRYFRHFVLIAVIVAAIITPPDVTSQTIMAAPMIVLYGVSILLAWIFGKPPTDAQREAYARHKQRRREKRKK